jgi:hypothetical protein
MCAQPSKSWGLSSGYRRGQSAQATTETKSKGHQESRLMNSARVVYEIDDQVVHFASMFSKYVMASLIERVELGSWNS